MASRGYSWKNVRQGSTFSLPKTEHLGRIVTVAVVLALLAHVVVIFGLKNLTVSLPSLQRVLEIETEQVVVRDLEFRESLPELQQEELAEPPKFAGELLDEIEVLEQLPEDTEFDMSPEITEPEFEVEMMAPALTGEFMAEALEPIAGIDFSDDLPEIGKTEEIIQEASVGQLIIDPGAQSSDAFDPDKFNEELELKGADGMADNGALGEFTPLSAMTRMEGNALENAKGMIGSDLLFEFNQATLRESARNSLLKVALLIDKNPEMKCWIEGHTDTIGGVESNGQLSLRRALAVKEWLVKSMRIDPERLIVVGYGKSQPLIAEGDQDVQAMNRRVVIKMRQGVPEKTAGVLFEKELGALPDVVKEVVQEEPPKPKPPKAILIKPSGPPIIPKAEVIEELPTDRAVVIEENQPGRAVIIEEDAPGRAVIIEE